MSLLSNARSVSVLLVICGVTAYGGFVATDAALHRSHRDQSQGSLPRGENIEAVFVGASTCEASQSTALPRDVQAAFSLLRDSASIAKVQFTSIGVALDWNPSDGIDWLKRIGHFDEVISGRNWVNLGAIDYLWRDSLAVPALPQLIVATRTIRADSARIAATEPRTVVRLIGDGAIRAWVKSHGIRSGT